jgi:hypothetical protein
MEEELLYLTLMVYSLGAGYCSRKLQKGRMCIFVTENQSYNTTDTSLHCTAQTLELCAVELETKSSAFSILALYGAPSADFNQFIKRLDATLKYLYNPKSVLNLW